jgi:hypothetical protein
MQSCFVFILCSKKEPICVLLCSKEEINYFLKRRKFFLEGETEEVHGPSLDCKLKFTPPEPDLELEANVIQTGPYVCFYQVRWAAATIEGSTRKWAVRPLAALHARFVYTHPPDCLMGLPFVSFPREMLSRPLFIFFSKTFSSLWDKTFFLL